MASKTEIQRLTDRVSELLNKSLTGTNPLVITDTEVNSNVKGMAIYAITDATFTTLDTSASGNDLAAQTLPAGHIWYVHIDGAVKLAGGGVIVYRHSNA